MSEIPEAITHRMTPKERDTVLALETLVPFPRLEGWFTDPSGLRRFEEWTAFSARVGLLRWPERDTLVRNVTYELEGRG